MFKNTSISFLGYINLIIIFLLLIPLFAGYWLYVEHRDFRQQSREFESRYIQSRKEIVRSVVDNTVNFIDFKTNQVERRVRESIRARVDQAHGLAGAIVESQTGWFPRARIERIVLESLRTVGAGDRSAHFFVFNLDGTAELSVVRPGLEGRNIADIRDPQGRSIVRDMIRIGLERGWGYYRYQWGKPGAADMDFPKLSYVRIFEPFGWIIGSGEYLADMERTVKEEVVERIEQMRFGEYGYLWVTNLEPRMIVHPYYPPGRRPGWYENGGLRDYTTEDGRRLFVEMRDLALRGGGGFVTYPWNKPDDTGPFEKLSFVRLYEPWEWVIGAGIYISEIQAVLDRNERTLGARVRGQLTAFLLLFLVAVLVTWLANRSFFGRLTSDLDLFARFFERASSSYEKIDTNELSFRELRRVAEHANRMVDDRREADRQVASSEERMRQSQKMEAVGKLAGGVAHDFNNLLTAIIGYSDLMLVQDDLEETRRGYVAEIKKSARRAASLTQQLLAFSRKQVLSPRIISLNALVLEIQKMLQRLIGEDVRMKTDLAEDTGLIKADETQMQQVLMNLAVNARDAMPGGGDLTMETRNVDLGGTYTRSHPDVDPGRYVLLTISDTGQGMTPETLDRVFEPFFTTKESGKGTGLGLSMVYGIVKQSGGHIQVSSEPGHGTTFKIYLPRVAGHAAEAGREVLSDRPTGTETILVVEDDDAVRGLIVGALESFGYRVLQAENGEHALRLSRSLSSRGIDLLVTDMIMPDMSGKALSDRITADRRSVKVLYISGYTETTIVDRGVLGSGDSFMQKPFTARALALRVREVLDGAVDGALDEVPDV